MSVKAYISWDTFQKDCDVTAVQINKPIDYIIALSRGGVVPARMMAEIIKPKKFYIIGLKLYNGQSSGDEVEITQDLQSYSEFDRHDNILIIDDISDRGTTLQFAYSHIWKNSGGSNVSIACPYIKEGTSRVPNFYSREFSNDEWVVFPFEKD